MWAICGLAAITYKKQFKIRRNSKDQIFYNQLIEKSQIKRKN